MKKRGARRLSVDTPQINLVPMLDMISLLVMVLLLNAHFGVLAEVEATTAAGAVEDAGEALLLEVQIGPKGYDVAWSEGPERIRRNVPCRGECKAADSWDGAGLKALLSDVKRSHPDEVSVVLQPSDEVGFELVALTMDAVSTDAARKPLFPDVALAGR